MFATLLRRWRLVTPLVLVSLLSMMAAGSMLTPAAAKSSHKLHFAFAGDAAGMVDLTQFPAFSECFSGAIEDHGVNLDAIAIKESGCPNENLDAIDASGITTVDPLTGVATSTTLTGPLILAHADATEARIISDHTNTEGHVITDVINFGETVIFGLDDAVACASRGLVTPQECLQKVTPFAPVIGGDVNAGDFAHVRAEAECQKKHGRNAGHASALSASTFDDLDMEAASGGTLVDGVPEATPAHPVVEAIRELKPNAFTFTGGSVTYVTSDELGGTIVLIVNESAVQKSDDFAAISANALHFIEQAGPIAIAGVPVNAGGIRENILYAHAFAQIHCHAGTFSFEDPIGA